MNYIPSRLGGSPLPEAIDILLADIAIRIQLTKTDYDKAVDRFDVMRDWIDRDGSPLQGLVDIMYPQGSMATSSTVARVSDRDEYDLDVVVGLLIARDSDPQLVLDTLYQTIRGEPGSRYYDKTVRHTRCVCVSYEDGMHVDLTPAVLVPERLARTSIIFHSKPEDRSVAKRRLLANPWGFAEWFKAATPKEADFAKMFEERSFAMDRAPAEPVPGQQLAYHKSRALISLQLIKRWRNVLFTKSARSGLRRPPSVLLSKLVADSANGTTTLSEEVVYQARQMLSRLQHERALGQLIHEVNPACREDVLTDRWPETHSDQDLMIADLADFIGKLELLRNGDLSLDKMGVILEGLFGERPTRSAVRDYVSGGDRSHVQFGTGRIVRATTGLAAVATTTRPVSAHNFYGDPV